MDIKGICGACLTYIVGIARIAGGVISISSSTSATETWVGVGLIAVGLFIILSITMLLIKRSMFWLTMVALAANLFWVQGLVDSFILYGHASAHSSDLIINLCCAMAIMMLSRSIAQNVKDQ